MTSMKKQIHIMISWTYQVGDVPTHNIEWKKEYEKKNTHEFGRERKLIINISNSKIIFLYIFQSFYM